MPKNDFYTYLIQLKRMGTLGFEIDEFINNWNEFCVNNDLKIIEEVELINNTFSWKITNNLVLVGSIKKDFLQSITLIGSGDGTLKSGTQIILGISLLIMALNPQEDKKFAQKVLNNLGFFDKDVDLEINRTIELNSQKVSLVVSKQIGVWLTISI
jgi:hypothetical protein